VNRLANEEATMTEDRNIYGEVDGKNDLLALFRAIRRDVSEADDRPGLTELYRRAGYVITLTHAPSWREKFGKKAEMLRDVAEDEFTRTTRKINTRARRVGTDPDYDEHWGT
jgi:hypothetical protein